MQDVKEIVDNTFASVLEESTFLFADQVSVEEIKEFSHDDFFITYITFDGDVCGELFVLFAQNTAKELTINMLGIDEDEFDPDYMKDATMEFANMLCGKLVIEIFGSEKEYDISIPVINEAHDDLFKRLLEDDKTRYFMIEDKPALVNLMLV